MSNRGNRRRNNITRGGHFCHDLYTFKQSAYYKWLCLNKTPPLVRIAEKLGMVSKPEFAFGGYSIGKNTAAKMLYQLKIFFRWDTKVVYAFFKTQFVIDKTANDKLEVIYKPIARSFNH